VRFGDPRPCKRGDEPEATGLLIDEPEAATGLF